MAMDPISSLEAQKLEKAAEILKTVAHPVRLRIIDMLESGEKSVTELCQTLNSQQPYMSQQLNLMKSKGILASRRNGNQVYYFIANTKVVKVIHCVREQASSQKSGPEECLAGYPGPSVGDSEA